MTILSNLTTLEQRIRRFLLLDPSYLADIKERLSENQ